jgi:hypothetical protein
MTNPMENETVILKVAEFLEGDDLMRMRLSQAILATLSDPKHDFLWAKPCLELGVDSYLRPPWAEYQAREVKWRESRCFYATFLAWRGEFRGIECREVKKVKQWWTRMKEVLPLHVIASLNPPVNPDKLRGNGNAHLPRYWRLLWRFHDGQKLNSGTSGLLGGHCVYDHMTFTSLSPMMEMRMSVDSTGATEGYAIIGRSSYPKDMLDSGVGASDSLQKTFVLDSCGNVLVHMMTSGLLLQCHPDQNEDGEGGGWSWLETYLERIEKKVFREVLPPAQLGSTYDSDMSYISLVPWDEKPTPTSKTCGEGADEALGVESRCMAAAAAATAASYDGDSSDDDRVRPGERGDDNYEARKARSSCPRYSRTHGIRLQASCLFMPELSSVVPACHSLNGKPELVLNAHFSYEIRMGLSNGGKSKITSATLSTRQWTISRVSFDVRQREHSREGDSRLQQGLETHSDSVLGEGVIGMHPRLEPQDSVSLESNPGFRYASLCDSKEARILRPTNRPTARGTGHTMQKVKVDRDASYNVCKFAGDLQFEAEFAPGSRHPAALAFGHGGTHTVLARLNPLSMDIPSFIY